MKNHDFITFSYNLILGSCTHSTVKCFQTGDRWLNVKSKTKRERELRRKSTTNHTVQTNVCSLTLSAYETGIIRRRRCSARLSSSSSYRALSDKILCMQSTHTPHAPTHTHTHKWFLAEDLNARLDTRNSQPSMSIGFVFFFSATGCCCCC